MDMAISVEEVAAEAPSMLTVSHGNWRIRKLCRRGSAFSIDATRGNALTRIISFSARAQTTQQIASPRDVMLTEPRMVMPV